MLVSALFIEHLLDNDWMMTSCKCQSLQATGTIQNSNALYKGSNFVSSGELLEILSGADKKLLHTGELSSVKLLLSLIKIQFILALKQGKRLLCCVHC